MNDQSNGQWMQLSNGDMFENHDEMDFGFLGNRRRHEWKMQTNVYSNGSTDHGREECYLMPFNPTTEAHRFSILWSSRVIIFYIDGMPIREVPRSAAMGLDYPSKPMALDVTIWDGSTWATENDKYKVNYKCGPFTAEFSNLVLCSCRTDTDIRQLHLHHKSMHRCTGAEFELMTANYAIMTLQKPMAMRQFQRRQMLYTVRYDTNRFPLPKWTPPAPYPPPGD